MQILKITLKNQKINTISPLLSEGLQQREGCRGVLKYKYYLFPDFSSTNLY